MNLMLILNYPTYYQMIVVVSTLPNLPLIVVISLSKEPVLVSNVVNLVFCNVLVVFREPVSNSNLSNLYLVNLYRFLIV